MASESNEGGGGGRSGLELTVYPQGTQVAQRKWRATPDASGQTRIDTVGAPVPGTVLALVRQPGGRPLRRGPLREEAAAGDEEQNDERWRLLPHRLSDSGHQIVLTVPAGRVLVRTPRGNLEGDLEQLSPTEVSLRTRDGRLTRIRHYDGIDYRHHYPSHELALSYLIPTVTWRATHTVLASLAGGHIRRWQTLAAVRNASDAPLDADRLRLAFASLELPATSTPSYGTHRAGAAMAMRAMAPQTESKMAPAASAQRRRRSSADNEEEEKEEETRPLSAAELRDMARASREVPLQDLGSQYLPAGETVQLPVCEFRPRASHIVFYQRVELPSADRTAVTDSLDRGFRFAFDEPRCGAVLPAGPVTVYDSAAAAGGHAARGPVGAFLGTHHLREHRQGDEVTLLLGSAPGLGVTTTITAYTSDSPDPKAPPLPSMRARAALAAAAGPSAAEGPQSLAERKARLELELSRAPVFKHYTLKIRVVRRAVRPRGPRRSSPADFAEPSEDDEGPPTGSPTGEGEHSDHDDADEEEDEDDEDAGAREELVLALPMDELGPIVYESCRLVPRPQDRTYEICVPVPPPTAAAASHHEMTCRIVVRDHHPATPIF